MLAQSQAHFGHHSAVRGGLVHKLPDQTTQDQNPVLPLTQISCVTILTSVSQPFSFLNVNDSNENNIIIIL